MSCQFVCRGSISGQRVQSRFNFLWSVLGCVVGTSTSTVSENKNETQKRDQICFMIFTYKLALCLNALYHRNGVFALMLRSEVFRLHYLRRLSKHCPFIFIATNHRIGNPILLCFETGGSSPQNYFPSYSIKTHRFTQMRGELFNESDV